MDQAVGNGSRRRQSARVESYVGSGSRVCLRGSWSSNQSARRGTRRVSVPSVVSPFPLALYGRCWLGVVSCAAPAQSVARMRRALRWWVLWSDVTRWRADDFIRRRAYPAPNGPHTWCRCHLFMSSWCRLPATGAVVGFHANFLRQRGSDTRFRLARNVKRPRHSDYVPHSGECLYRTVIVIRIVNLIARVAALPAPQHTGTKLKLQHTAVAPGHRRVDRRLPGGDSPGPEPPRVVLSSRAPLIIIESWCNMLRRVRRGVTRCGWPWTPLRSMPFRLPSSLQSQSLTLWSEEPVTRIIGSVCQC